MKKRLAIFSKPIRHALVTVFGVVLVWRGIWLVLDWIDMWIFGGTHFWTGVIGVIVGFFILYIPDHRLDELESL